jgi:hypothetical protein
MLIAIFSMRNAFQKWSHILNYAKAVLAVYYSVHMANENVNEQSSLNERSSQTSEL